MQVCYFTGDMCQVDWQKNSVHRKLSLSLQHRLWTHYQSGGCQGQHGQTGGEEFRERSTPPLAKPLRCRVLNSTEPKWILQIFHESDRYMWQPKVRRRKRDENMREREKWRQTGSSIFSEAQHPAAQTSWSLVKKDGVFVKYTSFSAQENVALIDGCCAVQ